MTNLIRGLVIAFSVLASPLTLAQDISGNYTLDISQDPGADDCVWEGDLTLNQTGGNPGSFSGSAAVTVVSGPCFPFSGTVTGTINGTVLDIGVGVSGLGTAVFTGNVTGSGDLSGTWAGLGLTGVWSAAREEEREGLAAVPTMTTWSLLALMLLMVGVALRHRSRFNQA